MTEKSKNRGASPNSKSTSSAPTVAEDKTSEVSGGGAEEDGFVAWVDDGALMTHSLRKGDGHECPGCVMEERIAAEKIAALSDQELVEKLFKTDFAITGLEEELDDMDDDDPELEAKELFVDELVGFEEIISSEMRVRGLPEPREDCIAALALASKDGKISVKDTSPTGRELAAEAYIQGMVLEDEQARVLLELADKKPGTLSSHTRRVMGELRILGLVDRIYAAGYTDHRGWQLLDAGEAMVRQCRAEVPEPEEEK
jgi:hypothetical protein